MSRIPDQISGLTAQGLLKEAKKFGLTIKKKYDDMDGIYDKDGKIIALVWESPDYDLETKSIIAMWHRYVIRNRDDLSLQGKMFIDYLLRDERAEKIAAGRLFSITWKAVQEKYIEIEADSKEAALEKFYAGNYNLRSVEINDEDALPEHLGGYLICEEAD